MSLRLIVCLGVSAVMVIFAASARAQDYTVSTTSNHPSDAYLYLAPPTSGAATLSLGLNGTQQVTLPFSFAFFGATYSTVFVCSNGFLQIGVSSPSPGTRNASNASFPIAVASEQGTIAPYWDSLGDPSAAGAVRSWTAGSAPNRIFVVSWEGVSHASVSGLSLTFQAQLHEATNRIVIAYKPDAIPTTWGGNASAAVGARTSYSAGIQAPSGDARFLNPPAANGNGYSWGGPSSALCQRPLADVRFDPVVVTYAGTLQYDRIVSDASGVGNSEVVGVPLANTPVELRRADGAIGFRSTTDDSGAFSIRGIALDSANPGSLTVSASFSACEVRASTGGAPLVSTVKPSLSFAGANGTTTDVGTIRLGSALDPSGERRAPFEIASVVTSTLTWLQPRIAKPIGPLLVLYDSAASDPSGFTYAVGQSPAVMRVASAASSNGDAWDAQVVRRLYGRHVLATIAAAPSTGADLRFDTRTDDENAFADAFGAYLHGAISGEGSLIDGLSSSASKLTPLESAVRAVPPSADRASAIAAVLYDLVDAANEPCDRVDGTTADASARPLDVVSGLTAPVTAGKFLDAWAVRGFGGPSLARLYVQYGVLADDVHELNDDSGEPADFGALGRTETGLVLNKFDDDWFVLRSVGADSALEGEVFFDRSKTAATVALDLLDAAGAVFASGAAIGATGPFRVRGTAPEAGDVFVRVRHAAGERIADYSLQLHAPIEFESDAVVAWTKSRPYTAALRAAGGVPPYVLSVEAPGVQPPWMVLDVEQLRVTGTPSAAARSVFFLKLSDSGTPPNSASVPVDLTVNPELALRDVPFVAFALGRATRRAVPREGGTPPYADAVAGGSLPDGLLLDAARGEIGGTAASLEFTTVELQSADVAGSSDARTYTAVVCAPLDAGSADLPLSAEAVSTGFYLDAVAGSALTLVVHTSEPRQKRALSTRIIGPDGLVVSGSERAGQGRVFVKSLPCAASGRYFCVVSADSGAAGQLCCRASVAPPHRVSGRDESLGPGERVVLEAGALPGAKLTLRAVARGGLRVRVESIVDPSGEPVNVAQDAVVTTRGGALTLRATLPRGGTWTIAVAAIDGETGSLSWTLSLKQPKGATFDADE